MEIGRRNLGSDAEGDTDCDVNGIGCDDISNAGDDDDDSDNDKSE